MVAISHIGSVLGRWVTTLILSLAITYWQVHTNDMIFLNSLKLAQNQFFYFMQIPTVD